jgi:hypothetical protein
VPEDLSRSQVFTFEERFAPVLCIRVDGSIEDADLVYLFQTFEGVHRRGARFCLVIDALRADAPSPRARQLLRDWTQRHQRDSERLCASSAVVYPSKLLVGVLAALNWMQTPPYPQRAFSSLSDAIRWTLQGLEGRNLRPAPGLTSEALLRWFGERSLARRG